MPSILSRPQSVLAAESPSKTQVARLVAAVSKDTRALRILADNTSGGWCEVAVALASETSFAVVCRQDIAAFDADTPQAVQALAHVVSECETRNLSPVVVASGGTGRQHLFVVVSDPVFRNDLITFARSAGIDVRAGSPIRPPGVVHRTGRAPTLLLPASWDAAATALEQGEMGVVSLAALSRRLASLIEHGDREGKFRGDDGTTDGSRLVLAICNVAVAEGVSKQRVYQLLLSKTHVGGQALRKRLAQRGPRWANAWFDLVWRKASDSPSRKHERPTHDPEVVNTILGELEAFLNVPHPGQLGNSEVAVFVAATILALRWGRGFQAPMSVRDLALVSGKDTKTVMSALGRLTAGGRLQKTANAHLDAAAIWEITRTLPTPLGYFIGGCRGGGMLRELISHDAMAVGALGAGGFRVLSALSDEGQTPCELSNKLGMHPGTVRRHLARLLNTGVIEVDSDGLWVVSQSVEELAAPLNAVAVLRQTSGRFARRRLRFEKERVELRRVLVSGDERLVLQLVLAQNRRDRSSIRVPSLVANRKLAA